MANQQNVLGQVFEQLAELPKKAAQDTAKAAGDIASVTFERVATAGLPGTVTNDQQGKLREQGQVGSTDPAMQQKKQEERRRFQQVRSELEQYQQRLLRQKQQQESMKQQEQQQKKQEEVVKKKEKESFLTRLLNKASSESTGETLKKQS